MNIVCGDQANSRFSAHPDKLWVDTDIFRHTMILQFQEEVIFSENVTKFQCCCAGSFIVSFEELSLHISGKTGTGSDKSAAVLTQEFFIDTRLIIESFRKRT